MKHITKRGALITSGSAAVAIVGIGVTAAIVGPAPQTTAASSPTVNSTSTATRTVTTKPQPKPTTTRTVAPTPTATARPVVVKATTAPRHTVAKTHKVATVKDEPKPTKAPTCADHVTNLVALSVTPDGEWNAERIGSDAPGAKPPHCISDTVQWFMDTQSAGGCAKIGMASKNPKFKPGIGPSITTAPVVNDPLDQFGTC